MHYLDAGKMIVVLTTCCFDVYSRLNCLHSVKTKVTACSACYQE